MKVKRISISLLILMTLVSCTSSKYISLENRLNVKDSKLSSKTILSKEEIAERDKEYSFSTKALSVEYFKRKLQKLISSNQEVKVVKELEYARIKGESKIPAQAMFLSDGAFFTTLTSVPLVITERTINSPFDVFLGNLNPYPSSPTNLNVDQISLSGFRANWNAVSGATSYDIVIDDVTTISSLSGTSYTATGLSGANHTWRVKANKNTLSSSYTSNQNVIIAYDSCNSLHLNGGINTNGVYWIDTDGVSGNSSFKVYCDMNTNGGGWTMVVSQYENDPLTNWNEGVQNDYDPTLATMKSFTLNSSQIPTHTQTSFGQNLDPTFIDYANFLYTTGNIPKTLVSGIKTSNQYHIFRGFGYYDGYDPESSFYTTNPSLHYSLTFDKTGGMDFTWA
ncbi:MAG: fibrinogen-like YCDxxxxGGGW domain-containing protein, partial [Candidatus Sericytochromatia bacterium]